MIDPNQSGNRTTLLTLAKQSKQVGAFKVARYAYEKLQVSVKVGRRRFLHCSSSITFSCVIRQSLKIPTQLQEIIDTGTLTIRSKPFQDKEVGVCVCPSAVFACLCTTAICSLGLCRNSSHCAIAVPPPTLSWTPLETSVSTASSHLSSLLYPLVMFK